MSEGTASGLDQCFWGKVEVGHPLGCWAWLGYRNALGYGHYMPTRHKVVKAHRYAYEQLMLSIPGDLVLDHLCRNPSCVNPDHLEPVTQRENVRRGQAARRQWCKHGHLYTSANTGYKAGYRYCKTCKRGSDRQSRTSGNKDVSRVGKANRKERAQERFRAGEVDPPHGELNTYTYYGCRCNECRTAMSVANGRRRGRR